MTFPVKKPPEKGQNPFSAYAAVSQIAFIVVAPLLLFIWGGSWLVGEFSLPGWMTGVFVVLGILTMISSLVNYLLKLIKIYGTDKKDEHRKIKNDRRDYDFYDDFQKKYKNKL